MDALWPESDGDSARRALTTAVFRLRRLLHETSLVRSGGRLALNPAVCWVDAWALERLLDRCDVALSSAEARSDAPSLVMQAVALYHGPLIGAGENDWSTSRDCHLRDRLHRQLVAVGQVLVADTNWPMAATLLEAALSIDPCAEAACRLLMTTYHHMERPAAVTRVYDRCKRALEREMGLRPSKATEATFARLRGQTAPGVEG